MNKTTLSIILALISSVSQGFVGIIVKCLDTPPLALVSLRSLLAAGVLFAYSAITKKRLKSKNVILRSIIAGIFLAGHWAAFFISLRLIPIAIATTALFTFPVMTAIAEPLVFRQKMRLIHILAGLVTMLGIWLIIPGNDSADNLSAGVSFALLSALFFVIRNLICKNDTKNSDGIALMSWQTLTAGLILFPFVLGEELEITSGSDIILILILGIILTAVSHTVRVVNMRHLPITIIDIISTLQVAVAGIAAWIMLNERLEIINIVGMIIVLGTVSGESLYFFYRAKSQKSEVRSKE